MTELKSKALKLAQDIVALPIPFGNIETARVSMLENQAESLGWDKNSQLVISVSGKLANGYCAKDSYSKIDSLIKEHGFVVTDMGRDEEEMQIALGVSTESDKSVYGFYFN